MALQDYEMQKNVDSVSPLHLHNIDDGTQRLNPKDFKGFPVFTAVPTHVALEGTIIVTRIDSVVSLYVMQNKTWHKMGVVPEYLFYGDGSDGDVVISSNTTLTADMEYDSLTINNGIVLNPGGYRIFVKGTLTLAGTGKIACNGGAGGNGGDGATTGSTQTAGTAGSAGAIPYTDATFPDPAIGVAGVTGRAGNDSLQQGIPGVAGTDRDKAQLEAGKLGGNGGFGATGVGGAADGGAAGAGGSTTYSHKPVKCITDVTSFIDTVEEQIKILYPSVGGSSGGSGGGFGQWTNDRFASGGSGGSGSSGGMILVFAKNIVTVDGNVYCEALGGDGGDAGASSVNIASSSNSGGSGGSAGGNGGIIFLMYFSKTGTGTLDVSGGIGGSGASKVGSSNPQDGFDGQDGYDGLTFDFS